MSTDNKITFHDFTELVAKRSNVSSAEAESFIHQLAKNIGHALEGGREVPLHHFGRFHLPHVDAHQGHNPGTGAALMIPAHTNVHFRAYSALRIAVNLPFGHLRTRMLPAEGSDRQRGVFAWFLLGFLVLAVAFLGYTLFNRMAARTATREVPVVAAEMVIPAPVVVAAPLPVKTVVAESTGSEILVARGDTLWAMAETQLGDSAWWPVIYAENRGQLASHNPDLIEVGAAVRIPSLEGSAAKPTVADLALKTSAYQVVADDYAQLNNPRAPEYRADAIRGFTR